MKDEQTQFGAADFVVFLGMLLFSLGIGIYYAIKDRKNKSVENYYFGGRAMSPIPVGLSISVTFVSSITVLALPAHAYVYGSVIIWFGLNVYLQIIVACVYYIPLYHRLKLSSVYEYLELRYHRAVRSIASVMITVLMVIYMSTTIYLTSISLSAVTPMSVVASIILTSGICTIYTSLGGMKAVVWNDAFQAGIMIIGIFSLMVKAAIVVGGFGNVWEAVTRGERDTFFTFDPDPTLEHSFWTIMVGGAIGWTTNMCTNQAIVQRYQSCKSVRDARIASVLGCIPMVAMMTVSTVSGCVMYAYFEGCDPVKDGKLRTVDQTVTYLAVQLFQEMPGMAGLFVAAAYSGMLSTVSSGINSLAALVLEDFIIQGRPSMKNNIRLHISKGLSITFGLLTMAIVFVIMQIKSTVVQIIMTVFGSFGGPIFATYAAGIHFPWTNSIGAGSGLIFGVIFSLWIAIGGLINPTSNDEKLPFSTQNCTVPTNLTTSYYPQSEVTTAFIAHNHLNTSNESVAGDSIYSLSFFYIAPVGFIATVIVSMMVTLISGKNSPENLDPVLFIPLVDHKLFHPKIRKFFRFGVPELDRKNSEEMEEKPSLLAEDLNCNSNK